MSELSFDQLRRNLALRATFGNASRKFGKARLKSNYYAENYGKKSRGKTRTNIIDGIWHKTNSYASDMNEDGAIFIKNDTIHDYPQIMKRKDGTIIMRTKDNEIRVKADERDIKRINEVMDNMKALKAQSANINNELSFQEVFLRNLLKGYLADNEGYVVSGYDGDNQEVIMKLSNLPENKENQPSVTETKKPENEKKEGKAETKELIEEVKEVAKETKEAVAVA